MTDGSAGLKVISPSLGFIDFNTATGQYFLIFIVAVITLFFGINLMRTRTGRAFIAIRDNERAAEAVGINPVATKMLAFFIGCAMAGTAGSLMAHWSGFININSFSLADSVFYAGILLICGFGTMWAPVIGGILLVLIKHQLAPMLAGTDLSPAQNLSNLITAYSGIILVLLIIVFLIIHRKKLLDSSLRWK
jgi:branched-chain amino acid transport system permease protein